MKQPHIYCPSARKLVSGASRSYVNTAYADAIQTAGGILHAIDSTERPGIWKQILEDHAAGILLQGGQDIHPASYGEKPTIDVSGCDRSRDSIEIRIVKKARELGIPVFGICRGLQIMNVALGGTLIQDLSGLSKETHYPKKNRAHLAHSVAVSVDGGYIANLLDGTCRVNSMHHQAIERLGEDLSASVESDDGVIEAIESPFIEFFVGVQWHPEELTEDKVSRRLFKTFVEQCRYRR